VSILKKRWGLNIEAYPQSKRGVKGYTYRKLPGASNSPVIEELTQQKFIEGFVEDNLGTEIKPKDIVKAMHNYKPTWSIRPERLRTLIANLKDVKLETGKSKYDIYHVTLNKTLTAYIFRNSKL
jgi:hypothetical protein